MTMEERTSARNGIWLCASCNTIVDTSPAAFPADTLRLWKQQAERAATREAHLTAYETDGLIADIDSLYHAMSQFVWTWTDYGPLDWESGYQQRLLQRSAERTQAYMTQIRPKTIDVVERLGRALGQPTLAQDLENDLLAARTNNLGMIQLAGRLLELRAQVLLR
jgi:hypothetical protein